MVRRLAVLLVVIAIVGPILGFQEEPVVARGIGPGRSPGEVRSGNNVLAVAATVGMAGRRFSPSDISILAGDTVQFVNDDKDPHTVTSDSGAFDSGTLRPGQSYSLTLTSPGDYFYHCDFHGGMTGVIRVVSPPPTNTPIPLPTDTPVPPTNTPVPPTNTPVPPTNTPVPPTDTPVPPTATATEAPPTLTATTVPIDTATATTVPTDTATDTPTATATEPPVATATPTEPAIPTNTPTPLPPETATPTNTAVPTDLPTATEPPAPGTAMVEIADYSFSPPELTIAVGDSVMFMNAGQAPHTATADGGAFDTGMLRTGQNATVLFAAAGDYAYHCDFHPEMVGMIHVLATAPEPTATQPPAPTDVPTQPSVPTETATPAETATSTEIPPATATVTAVPTDVPTEPPTATAAPTSTSTPVATEPPVPGGLTVEIADYSFSPADLTVEVGASITFTNLGQKPHTATAAGVFDTGMLKPGQSATVVLDAPGDYAYNCEFHPEMVGVIHVTGAAATPDPTATEPPVPTEGTTPATDPTATRTPSPVPTATQTSTPGATQPPAPSETPVSGVAMVDIRDFSFSPAELTIAVGSSVMFMNVGQTPHTATADGGAFDTGMLRPGQNATILFDTPGDFSYACLFHPDMVGIIHVVDRSPVDGTPTPKPSATATPKPKPTKTPTQTPAGALTVKIVGRTFEPAELTIDPGQMVTFVNASSEPHTATGSTFDTDMMMPGDSVTITFDTSGTFDYRCIFHPEMTGRILVRGEDGSAPPPPEPTEPATGGGGGASGDILMMDFSFSPASITVSVGTTVTWGNAGAAPHTATALDGSFDSGIISPGGGFSFTFTAPGTFPFMCALHPQMQGTVTVVGADGTAPPAASATASKDAAAAGPGEIAVDIADFAFNPTDVTVPPGTTVVWTNSGAAPHTVTGDFADSGTLMPGQSFKYTFDKAGEYPYICAFHPNMVGKVIVDEKAAPVSADKTGSSGGLAELFRTFARLIQQILALFARFWSLIVASAPPAQDNGAIAAADPTPAADGVPSDVAVASADTTEPADGAVSTTAVTAGGDEPAAPQSVAVSITDTGFSPSELTVTPGTTVIWTNDGTMPHTVTGPFGDSGMLSPGQTFQYTVAEAGSIDYVCLYHPFMTAKIEVSAAIASTDHAGHGNAPTSEGAAPADQPAAPAAAAESAASTDTTGADAANAPAAARFVTIQLHALNGSGINGEATLTADGDKTVVSIHVSGPNVTGQQPAHIHAGTCDQLNPTPGYGLSDIDSAGDSVSTVDVSLDDLLAKPYWINVHKSYEEIDVYVACGNIVASDGSSASAPVDTSPTSDVGDQARREEMLNA